jgi:hypothetical protein
MARRIVAQLLARHSGVDRIAAAPGAQLADHREQVHGGERHVPHDGGPERIRRRRVVKHRAERAAEHGQRAQPHHLLDRVGSGEDEVGDVSEQVG